jgi:flagellar protein FlgJ
MSAAPVSPAYYADLSGMEGLKHSARANDPAAVREAARQFESLFTNMLLKSMRQASLGDGLGDSEQTKFYQEMFDQQLALQMSRGKGLGLADMLVHQLQRTGVAPPTAGAAQPGASAAARSDFISRIWPHAAEAARRMGVAPEIVVAHAALETGWGQHLPADAAGQSNNLFGIKASTGGTDAATTEWVDGARTGVRARFRAYDSIGACVQDYANLLCGNPRYAASLNAGEDANAFASALVRGGYATDPDYARKLEATVASVRDITRGNAFKGAAERPINVT